MKYATFKLSISNPLGLWKTIDRQQTNSSEVVVLAVMFYKHTFGEPERLL